MPSFLHFITPADPTPARWQGIQDRIIDDPKHVAVSQETPATVGISTSRWYRKISPAWYYAASDNDAQAATDLVNDVNALTAAGANVVLDEVRLSSPNTTSIVGLMLPYLTHPGKVWVCLTAGTAVSYAVLDSNDVYPVITDLLAAGCNILPEIYPPQALAEKSGNVENYLMRYFRGPSDGRMPYLLETANIVDGPSKIMFLFSVADSGAAGDAKGSALRLPKLKYLDLVFRHARRVYPGVSANGAAFYKWESKVVRTSSRATGVLTLADYYFNGGAGDQSGGKTRYYTK